MIKLYWNTIFRNIWKNRANAIINVLGLSMGLASCLFLYVFLKYEYSFDTSQPKADRIYRINITKDYPNRTMREGNTESFLAKAVRNEFPELEAVIQLIGPTNALLTIEPGTTEERVFENKRNIFYADSNFLKHLEYDFVAGNPKTALDDFNNIVLSSELVARYYPDFVGRELELLGRSIEIHEQYPLLITGVIDSPPANSNFPFQALVSSEIYYKMNEWDRDNWGNIAAGLTYVVLQENQQPEEIERGFPALVQKYRTGDEKDIVSYSLLNLTKLHSAEEWGYSGNYTSPKPLEIGFIAIGIFVLLSACINFINLQTAQSINRAKEVGIRKVMGSGRGQLLLQFLLETAVITTVAFVLGLWVTEIVLNQWNQLLSIINADLKLDWSVVGIGAVLILLVTLVAGLYPAIILSSFKPVEALRSKFSSEKGANRSTLNLRRILVVTQFVICQILLIGTIVVSSQMDYFVEKDLGFDKTNRLHISNYDPSPEQIGQLEQGLSSMPEVEAFSLSSGPPMSGRNYNTTFQEAGNEEKGDMRTENKFVDHRYLDLFDLELVAGRNFRPDEYNDTITGFIVNEQLVRRLDVQGPADAIGKQIKCYGVNAPIVGVVKDFHNTQFNEEISPVIFFCWNKNSDGANIKLSGSDYASLLPKLETLWREVYPSRTFNFMPMDDYLLQHYIVEDIMFKSIRVFALIAIIIGCLGLYGLVSYMAVRKTKEIGIRKVLGASYEQILMIFSGRFFVLILISFVIAAPLAFKVMELWLSNYAYRIPLDWKIFASGLVVSIILTTVTVGYTAMRTALRNPVDALHFE